MYGKQKISQAYTWYMYMVRYRINSQLFEGNLQENKEIYWLNTYSESGAKFNIINEKL